MAVGQLPVQMRDFAEYLNGLMARLDQAGGWCGVFWQRDPDGMRACLDGWEVPPWDVVAALLQDLAAEFGDRAADQEGERARALHGASLAAYDARPGGRDALSDRLDVMLREQRYAAERQAELNRQLPSAGSAEEAESIRLDLAWAHDDHERASARCAELRRRMVDLDRRALRPQGALAFPPRASGDALPARAPDGLPTTTGDVRWEAGAGADARGTVRRPQTTAHSDPHAAEYSTPQATRYGDPQAETWSDPAEAAHHPHAPLSAGASAPHSSPHASAEPLASPQDPSWASRGPRPAEEPAEASGSPRPTAETMAPVPKQRSKRRPRGSARFAGMMEQDDAPEAVPQAVQALPAPAAPSARRTPRGARFAGAAEEPEQPRTAPVDGDALRATSETVAVLTRLRGEGRSGEAHALLVEAAYWPAARFPLLAAELHRAGLDADWATLLWEAASLPADRLVAAADALTAAGRSADGRQMLRQGVARPAPEIGAAVLGLAEDGRDREIRALLGAYVRVRTPEEAARSAEADPQRLVPLLLEAAREVSDERHWDLVHALRVAGHTA
ncbi:hypothetical protein BKI49_30065 [Streptomyces sp. Tue6028]|uniref:hypothetical protein n=1 Tax=Streptomyces sp. Tue6028 TaxID=2036037 RepID=UPI000BB380B9|nr:hypothetical protein [Streptomyces sp. Tue6028]PBC60268.1 hypothetical protein BKI49_30065 [Streptomyces sp. Tue6028]